MARISARLNSRIGQCRLPPARADGKAEIIGARHSEPCSQRSRGPCRRRNARRCRTARAAAQPDHPLRAGTTRNPGRRHSSGTRTQVPGLGTKPFAPADAVVLDRRQKAWHPALPVSGKRREGCGELMNGRNRQGRRPRQRWLASSGCTAPRPAASPATPAAIRFPRHHPSREMLRSAPSLWLGAKPSGKYRRSASSWSFRSLVRRSIMASLGIFPI